MAFRPRNTSTPPPEPSGRRPRRGLTAASEMLQERIAQNSQTEPGWQKELWAMWREVPELRTAARVTAQAMSQCRFILARSSDNGEPVPLDYGTPEKPGPDADHPARRLLAGFAGGAGGQAELLDAMGVFLTVTGEGIIVGALDPDEARRDTFLRARAYAPAQVSSSTGRVTVRTGENSQFDRTLADEAVGAGIATPAAVAVRVWRPSPEFSWEADSAGRAALPILREIRLYDAHLRASALSRISGAGLLLVPEDLTLPGVAVEDGTEDPDDPFMELLIEVMSAAIQDRESAAAMVPLAIRGAVEDLEAIRHLSFSTPFDEKILDLRANAIERLAVAVDMPGELLSGLGSLQHWTGSLITDTWINNTLSSLMSFVCGSLTTGWLYPALSADAAKRGEPSPLADVFLWFDSSALKARPNASQDAQALYDRNEISGDALRRSAGFDDGDAPEPKDLERSLLINLVRGAPSLAPVILPLLGINLPDIAVDEIADADPGNERDAAPPVSAPAPGSQEPETGQAPGRAAAEAEAFARIVAAANAEHD